VGCGGPRRPEVDYGFDAPIVPALMAAAALALVVVGLVLALGAGSPQSAVGPLLGAVFFLPSAGVYVHATRRGKFAVWEDLLRELAFRGDERVLDIGCGRGAVLLMAAKQLPVGRAAGLDQSGNRPEAPLANADAEGAIA
jgi:SAM-dependent methyltransferase